MHICFFGIIAVGGQETPFSGILALMITLLGLLSLHVNIIEVLSSTSVAFCQQCLKLVLKLEHS